MCQKTRYSYNKKVLEGAKSKVSCCQGVKRDRKVCNLKKYNF